MAFSIADSAIGGYRCRVMNELQGQGIEYDTAYNHYRIADAYYEGRPARVLYSGNGEAAESGVARDGEPELLFDYNQRFRELVEGIRPRSLLLLGGGAFTLPTALMEEFPDMRLDIVELDEALVAIAEQYFGFRPNGHTNVHVGDGRRYLDTRGATYDMIIMDVFMHAAVPGAFQTPGAARGLRSHLRRQGIVAMNVIGSLHGPGSRSLCRMQRVLRETFREVRIFPASRRLLSWLPQNYVMTAQNGTRDIAHLMRYGPVELE